MSNKIQDGTLRGNYKETQQYREKSPNPQQPTQKSSYVSIPDYKTQREEMQTSTELVYERTQRKPEDCVTPKYG